MAKVLVIEDNPVNMKLALLLLHNAGHGVLCADDAESGLTLARAALPDLVLMDFQLPGMDGLAATALLKQDPATAAIPVIALTALTQEVAQAAGCDAFVAKPLHYAELYAAIDSVLEPRRARAADAAMPLPGADAQAAPESPPCRGTAPHAATALHLDVLAGLVGSDPLVILEFLDAFQISAAKTALAFKAACLEHRAVAAGKQAHQLKSAAHTVGALALAELCVALEAAGQAGDSDKLTALLPVFERELEAVNIFIDSFRRQPPDRRAVP